MVSAQALGIIGSSALSLLVAEKVAKNSGSGRGAANSFYFRTAMSNLEVFASQIDFTLDGAAATVSVKGVMNLGGWVGVLISFVLPRVQRPPKGIKGTRVPGLGRCHTCRGIE